jgi:hypothetical protein
MSSPYTPALSRPGRPDYSDVTSQEDVDYHGAKLEAARKRYQNVITQAPGQSIGDFSKEFIAQGPVALKAMEYETSELMQAIPHEKVTEECRPLIDDMFSETQAYYHAEELVFKAVSSGASHEQFKALDTLQDTAISNQSSAIQALDCRQELQDVLRARRSPFQTGIPGRLPRHNLTDPARQYVIRQCPGPRLHALQMALWGRSLPGAWRRECF